MGVSDRGDNFQESYPLKSVDLVRNDATYPAIPGEHLEGRPADDTEMNPGRGERSWSKVWYDFSQKTTLHGISQITETTPFAVRRWVSIGYSYCPFSWYMCMVRIGSCRTHAPLEVVILHMIPGANQGFPKGISGGKWWVSFWFCFFLNCFYSWYTGFDIAGLPPQPTLRYISQCAAVVWNQLLHFTSLLVYEIIMR